MFPSKKPTSEFEATQCPVCRSLFGKRDKSQIYQAHCAECKATYWWKPRASRPTVVLDSVAEKFKCGCGRCGR